MNNRFWNAACRLCQSVVLFLNGEEGPTAAEYAIMAGLIGAVIVGAVTVVGAKVVPLFEAVNPGLTP